MDKKKIEEAVRLFLEGIGENPDREGLLDTPERISAMCEELFAGIGECAGKHMSKTFTAQRNELVVERDITFYSVCEHHFLPFYGQVHIGYIPDGRVVGLSKLARTVEVYARRPQIQEQLTAQIADEIMEYLAPKGVMVMVEAEHMCMTMRGIKKARNADGDLCGQGRHAGERDAGAFFSSVGSIKRKGPVWLRW